MTKIVSCELTHKNNAFMRNIMCKKPLQVLKNPHKTMFFYVKFENNNNS